ncbi:hypothetical protein ACFOZY_04120 [Chungangia koreensis]|uniref:Uncharacterized protein n=1 Tax=Chungangia koreensis TaxID=752657 RepID=A0ABV8X2V0_9LACT
MKVYNHFGEVYNKAGEVYNYAREVYNQINPVRSTDLMNDENAGLQQFVQGLQLNGESLQPF